MSRSFRFHLAVRFTAAMTVTAATIGAASLLGLRAMLDRELNGTILNIASIQAASVTDSPETPRPLPFPAGVPARPTRRPG